MQPLNRARRQSHKFQSSNYDQYLHLATIGNIWHTKIPQVLPMSWALLMHCVNFAESRNLRVKSQCCRRYQFLEPIVQILLGNRTLSGSYTGKTCCFKTDISDRYMLPSAHSQQNTHTQLQHLSFLNWHRDTEYTTFLSLREKKPQLRSKLSCNFAGQYSNRIGGRVSVGSEEKLSHSQALYKMKLKLFFGLITGLVLSTLFSICFVFASTLI